MTAMNINIIVRMGHVVR